MIQRPSPIALALAALVAAFLLAPLLAVIPISLTPARFLTMPNGELSLIHYRELIDNPDWARSILLSLRIGLVSSVIATALALAFALGVWMFQPPFAALLVGFVMLPMIVPPVVSAMILYFFLTSLSQVSEAVGYDTWLGVTLAHVVMIVPCATLLILVALFLLAPLLAVVPISLTPARFLTMPTGALSLIHYRELIDNPDWGLGAAVSVTLVVIVGVLMGALFRFARPAMLGGAR